MTPRPDHGCSRQARAAALAFCLALAAATGCGSGHLVRPVTRPGTHEPPAAVAARARTLTGTAYRAGGTSPAGFDCSGLVQYLYTYAGVSLPRTAEAQFDVGREIEPDELTPGDLVFFRIDGRRVSHVGIVTGERQFVHAPNERSRVRVDRLDSRYWAQRFAGARRIVDY